MSWSGSENKRRPQKAADCPNRFRGNARYVPRSGSRIQNPPVVAGLMPFGRRWKGKPIASVPTGYLLWILRDVRGYELLKDAIRDELQKRGE